MKRIPDNTRSLGYRWLVDHYELRVIPHFCWSFIIDRGARRVLADQRPLIYLYDKGYEPADYNDPFQHVVFALKHEGFNLEILTALFSQLTLTQVHNFVAKQPSGKYQRIIWYMYEMCTGQKLSLPDLTKGSYIDVLDSTMYYTNVPREVRRQRINNNLLGDLRFCPFVRRTTTLQLFENKKINAVVRDMLKSYDGFVVERASHYLYAHETLSSYQIEQEVPNKCRLDRFVHLVKRAEKIPTLTDAILIELQNAVVEKRFVNQSYRTSQNYIGQMRDWYSNIIHYISPKPEDIKSLMAGLLASLERMTESNVHPIAIAAATSFGFVFIHPFDDGNGRLHRFLIHYILHKTSFAPPDMIFPVSATILSEMNRYNTTLESFSKPLMQAIGDFEVNDQGAVTVPHNTVELYRYIDYTQQAEFLASCIEKTVYTDLKNELEYLINYDKTKKEIAAIVDMPDHLIGRFINLVVQNNGTLSRNKRTSLFSLLTDQEIQAMEKVVALIMLAKA